MQPHAQLLCSPAYMVGCQTTRWLGLVLSLATGVLLCCAAHACLTDTLFRDTAPLHRFRIEAPGPGQHSSESADDQLWLDVIVADGRALRPDEVERQGHWSMPFLTWNHQGDPAPASLSFAAHSAVLRVLRSPWSGLLTLVVDGEAEVVDLYSPVPEGEPLYLDLPGWRPPWWTWLPFALLTAAAWALLRPWRSRRRLEIWLVGGLIAVHVLAWVSLPIGTVSDSLDYLPNLLQNLRFGYATYFPPGYGLFQATAMLLPGAALGGKITLLQHGLMVASLLGLWRLSRHWLPWSLSTTWLALVTWLAPTLFLPQEVLSENVALFTMTGCICFTHRAVQQDSVAAALAAAFCLGFGTIARVVPMAACAPGMLLLLLAARPWRRAAVLIGTTFAGAAIVIALPMLWFLMHGNAPTLSTGVARHMFNRVVYEQKLLDEDGAATMRLQQLLPGVDLRNTAHWDLHSKVADARARAAIDVEIASLIGEVAREAMRRHPLQYLGFTFPHAWRNLTADPQDHLLRAGGTMQREDAMETPPLAGFSAAAARFAQGLNDPFGGLWQLLCWLAVAGIAVIPWWRQRRLLLATAWVPIGYILTTSFVEYYLPRYNVAVTPFVAVLALLPCASLLAAVAARRVGAARGGDAIAAAPE